MSKLRAALSHNVVERALGGQERSFGFITGD
jgi:hypothetical protein